MKTTYSNPFGVEKHERAAGPENDSSGADSKANSGPQQSSPRTGGTPGKSNQPTIQNIAQYQTVHHHHYYDKDEAGNETDSVSDDYEANDSVSADYEKSRREHPKIIGPGCSPVSLVKGFFTIIMFPFRVWGFIRSLIWLILFVIISLILIIIIKPPALWNPLKTIINGAIQLPVIESVNVNDTYTKINDLAKGSRTVSLDESEFTTLAKAKLQPVSELRTGFGENVMRFYYNIDSAEAPLWLIIDFKQNLGSEKMEVTNISFGAVNLPNFLVSFFSNQLGNLQGVINNTISGNTSVAMMMQLLDQENLDKRLSLKTVKFEKEKVTLNFTYDKNFSF